MSGNVQLLLQILDATVAELIDAVLVEETTKVGVTSHARRSCTCHHVFCTLQGSTLHVLTIVVEHLVCQVATGQELAHCELRDEAVDEQPALVAAQVVELQRTETACTVGSTNPAREADFLLHLFELRIVLSHLDGLRNELCAFQSLR